MPDGTTIAVALDDRRVSVVETLSADVAPTDRWFVPSQNPTDMDDAFWGLFVVLALQIMIIAADGVPKLVLVKSVVPLAVDDSVPRTTATVCAMLDA